MKKHFLGMDIGTTSLKAAVFDEDGNRLALVTEDYILDTDAATGFIEFDAERYVTLCRDAVDRLIREVGTVDAISVDTQGETMILTDRDGTPLAPAVVWLDNRATEEAEAIRDAFGNRQVYEVTGQAEITAGWPASKLLWFKNHRPEIFRKTEKIFLLEDWILYRLTGVFATEPTIQSSTIYYDIVNKTWWQPMLDFIGIRENMLPTLYRSGEKIGTYRDIPVVTGALDQIAGTLGVGVTDSTRLSEMTGTIMAICAMTDTVPDYVEGSIIPCHIHAIDGKYCRILWSSTAGMALKWFKNNLAEDFSFRDLDTLAEKIPAGCEGMTMLPYFTGSTMPKYNPDATATFTGVTLSHTRGHFARAIMEAIAFVLREDLEYIGAESVREIRITGGGAQSPLWAQMKADVTGKELTTVTESETAALGTALLAAVGIGAFPSIEKAAEQFTKPKKVYRPSGTDYGDAYRAFKALDDLLNTPKN